MNDQQFLVIIDNMSDLLESFTDKEWDVELLNSAQRLTQWVGKIMADEIPYDHKFREEYRKRFVRLQMFLVSKFFGHNYKEDKS